jgi:hypothetical protein
MLNAFDLLIIVFLFIGIIYGAFRGASRQLIGLLSAWLGLIVCLWLYIPFSRQILKGLFVKKESTADVSNVVFDTFSFIMLLILFAVIVQAVFVLTTKSPEEKTGGRKKHFTERAEQKQSIGVLNVFGGLFTGFLVTLVWLSIFMAPIQYAVFSLNTGGGFIAGMKTAMTTSALLPLFRQVLAGIYWSISFFTPGGLPLIFRSFLGEGGG